MKPILTSFLGSLAAIAATIAAFFILLSGLITMIGALASSESDTEVKKQSILYLNLDTEISEYSQTRDLRSQLLNGSISEETLTVTDIVKAIDNAANDNKIDMMFIECNGSSAGTAMRQTILEAVKRFKATGKPVYAYGDNISQGDYYISSAADSIFTNPNGEVDIHGIAAQTLYFKGLLDKLGVRMQIVKVGTYKSAVEPFILTAPSEASIEQQRLFINNVWKEIRNEIAANRGVDTAEVDSWVVAQIATASVDDLIARHVVDGKIYRHRMLDKLAAATGNDKPRLVTIKNYLASDRIKKSKGKATIAVYNLEGDIVDSGKTGIVGPDVVEGILDLVEDDDIDALVLRVNSGGGSAFASEQIWEAVETFKAETGKKVYVSMSDYAASGGYYISSGADKIYAQSTTLTGSIGIFGMIPEASELLTDKLGLQAYTVSSHPEGEAPITIFNPLTERQREALQSAVDRGYELFVKRVADGRGMSVDDVKAIAEGRVWDGSEALRRGLVDELGGLEDCLADLSDELGLESYKVVNYPEVTMEWWEALLSSSSVEAAINARELSNSLMLLDILQKVRTLNPMQARMDYITLQ